MNLYEYHDPNAAYVDYEPPKTLWERIFWALWAVWCWLTPTKDSPPIDENKDDKKKLCACLEFIGDNPDCPEHGHIYREREKKENDKKEGSNGTALHDTV